MQQIPVMTGILILYWIDPVLAALYKLKNDNRFSQVGMQKQRLPYL
jgi:hypothetical protein